MIRINRKNSSGIWVVTFVIAALLLCVYASGSSRDIPNAAVLSAGPVASPTPAPHVSKDWSKGAPEKTTFHGKEGNCPFNGNASDPDQFMLKNRADVPSEYHFVTWQAIDELPYPGQGGTPHAPLHRKDWTSAQLEVIRPYEGIPLTVDGYIVAIKPQNGGSGEGTNCNFNQAGDVDAHIALVVKPKAPESSAIVIEWTPRFLKDHPNWTKAKLEPWDKSTNPVRISGWLMLDPDHVAHLGKFPEYALGDSSDNQD